MPKTLTMEQAKVNKKEHSRGRHSFCLSFPARAREQLQGATEHQNRYSPGYLPVGTATPQGYQPLGVGNEQVGGNWYQPCPHSGKIQSVSNIVSCQNLKYNQMVAA